MSDALIVQVTLTATLALFLFSKLRYDIVALLALFTLVLSGIVPAEDAFSGFGNPAVVTVVAVLVISRAMEKAGLGAWAYRIVADVGHNRILLIGSFCLLVALTSAFINNIGALALMLPVAMETCRKARISPSLVLMPMAFASLLGGMTTLIGTPSNLIVSDFRRHVVGEPFTM